MPRNTLYSPSNPQDFTGTRFTRLVVLREAPPAVSKTRKSRRWECQCDCGTVKVIQQNNLTTKATRSCGCLNREQKASWAGKPRYATAEAFDALRMLGAAA